MRRRWLVPMLAVGSAALARPAAPVTWADWIGEWQGKLKWSSCTIDGEPSATLPIEATDGAVAIDLAAAGAALGAMTLAEDNLGWTGQRGDVTVRLARPGDNTLELAVDLDSGCQVRGTLHRETTGIAACDRLAAWARIEGRCTKLTKPPLENAARLVRQRRAWLEARGEARTRLAAQCEARASKLASELVDAGCAPDPDPAIGMRGAECSALRQSAAKLGRCGNVAPDVMTALAREAADLVAAAQAADRAALPAVEAECRQLRERLVATGQQVGCLP